MYQWKDGTWFDDEAAAYPSGSLARSRRHFAALCPDGKVRRGICGTPDTFFSIPARIKVKGKTISGYLSIDDGTVVFSPTGKNRGIFQAGS